MRDWRPYDQQIYLLIHRFTLFHKQMGRGWDKRINRLLLFFLFRVYWFSVQVESWLYCFTDHCHTLMHGSRKCALYSGRCMRHRYLSRVRGHSTKSLLDHKIWRAIISIRCRISCSIKAICTKSENTTYNNNNNNNYICIELVNNNNVYLFQVHVLQFTSNESGFRWPAAGYVLQRHQRKNSMQV